NIATTEILIKNRKPVASLTIDKTFINTLEEVTFDASESYDLDGTELEYYFDFGDDTNSGWITDSVIKHTYTVGTKEYTIDLIVKDYDNETASTNYTITVSNRPPHADAGPDQSVDVHETVNFDASSSHDLDGHITEYKWIFGDGKDSDWITSAKTTHTYDYSGIYEVSLFVTDGEHQTSDICIITVSDIVISTPVISPNFPNTIEKHEDFGEMVLELTVYELHTNIDYTYDGLKWYVTGNSGTIFQITGDNSTGTTADTFVFTSIINEYGTEELTYHLYDPDGVEVIINQTVIVHPVNDPPGIALMAEITVNVNEELILDLEEYIEDVDTAFSELIIETDDMEHSEITGGSLVIIYDTVGEYYIQIQVKDGELTIDDTITVSVIDPSDKDNDGLPDTWEEQFGLDPNDPEDAKADFDNDFLKNFKEYELGTDPTKYDTDGDGFNDRVDPYPIDPTLPTKSTDDDKPIINKQILTIIIIFIVIILIIGILTSIIAKN
ncbi:MAG: PKD domain-containing protein, partial [Thermoplasmata archaeon]|nr:PKD domain-containing protein [Thermoplasmata archaeon]